MPTINDPTLIAEITTLHDAYERALAAHDLAALKEFFWDSELTVRYGVAEHLYGAEAIAAYRQGATPAFTDRVLTRRAILTIGTDLASIMCEISQKIRGQPRHSRQSQTWVRFPEVGWKIVSAHVSNAISLSSPNEWEAYAVQTAHTIGLPIAPEFRTGVAQTVERNATIIGPLLKFPLPEDVESAPVFTP